MTTKLIIQGAKLHNLKDVSLELPKNKLIVFTGLSGSGKSSLAFDTIYAEGQRRYVESLSAYARQFLEKLDKPDVDRIEGLSPAISIDQKTASHNPRSTVGTVTEIQDYLRLLFSSIGTPKCPGCGNKIQKQSPQEICDHLNTLKTDSLTLLSPLINNKKGEHQ
ncbi:excinuclease ABC subunit UvrA, partial [Candidatus Marinamargulisbacteria bacterium SCGC AG-439-L15]